MMLLAKTTEQGWQPGIGDPTIMGWLTVAAYLCAAYLCYRAHRAARTLSPRHGHASAGKAARIWLALALLLALLAVNKQLDLQSLFTHVGRSVAKRSGWYESRRTVQGLFITVMAAAGLLAIGWLAWTARHGWRTYGLALLGMAFIILFIVIRAASFHHVDEMLGWRMLGLKMNWILELGGLACVSIAAFGSGRSPRLSRPPVRSRRNPSSMRSPAAGQNPPASSAVQRQSFRWMVQRMRDRD